MDHLVDLSFIHRFSSFNIKQIGGGKIFYIVDANGKVVGRMLKSMSDKINAYSTKPPDYGKEYKFNTNLDSERLVIHFTISDRSGPIYGNINGIQFIGVDESADESANEVLVQELASQVPAGSVLDLELKPDRNTVLQESLINKLLESRLSAHQSSAASPFLAPSRLSAHQSSSSSSAASAASAEPSSYLSADQPSPFLVPAEQLSPFLLAPSRLSGAASALVPLTDIRRVKWSQNLGTMNATLIVIPSWVTTIDTKEDSAKKFANELGLLFHEVNLVASDKLLKGNKQKEGVHDNLFDLHYNPENFIAVVCSTHNEYILYFVDPSNGVFREIHRSRYIIRDVVFNPIHSDNKIQFVIILSNGNYSWSLVDFDFSNSTMQIKDIRNDMFECAIAFSKDGQSIIFNEYIMDDDDDDGEYTIVQILPLDNTDEIANQIIMPHDRCSTIKLSPSGDLIVMQGLYGIYVYDLTLQLHSQYIVNRDDPNFDDSNSTVNYNDRTCVSLVVDNFYRRFPGLPRLCIALNTRSPGISCIHLCDVNIKKKFRQFVFPDLFINQMELYLDKIHLILSTSRGIYVLNTITSQINKIMDRQYLTIAMIERSMFCSMRRTLERIDLHQLEDLLVDYPTAQGLLSTTVKEGEPFSESEPESELELDTDTGTRASQGSSKRQRKGSDGGRYNPIYIHHCY
jgi:hypothetical protein